MEVINPPYKHNNYRKRDQKEIQIPYFGSVSGFLPDKKQINNQYDYYCYIEQSMRDSNQNNKKTQ